MTSKTNFLGKHMKGLALKTETLPQNNTTFPLVPYLGRTVSTRIVIIDQTRQGRRSVLAGQQII